MTEDVPQAAAHHPKVGHHVPMWVLAATLAALLVLTFFTVAATWIDLGPAVNLWIALIIATIKAVLVALFFMHLAYDKPFNAIVLICALFFVLLFVGLTLMDTLTYQSAISDYRAEDPARYAPALPQQ